MIVIVTPVREYLRSGALRSLDMMNELYRETRFAAMERLIAGNPPLRTTGG